MNPKRKSVKVTHSFVFSIFVLFLSGLFSIKAIATNYYISASGNDAANGLTTTTPWQSIAKLNSAFSTIPAGSTIYFKRGDVFYGSVNINKSGTNGSLVILSAYGTGAKPIITGFTTITGWTNEGGGIYSKIITSDALTNMVVLDGKQLAMGRYPDTGFLTYESFTTNTSITDTGLAASPNWTGADIAIRKNDWTLDRGTITDHTGTTLTYNNNNSGTTQSASSGGFGYFILNDLKTLTTFGEWYHNTVTGKFYMYFGAVDPNTKLVQVATVNDLIYSIGGYDYITLDNLNLTGSINNGVYFKQVGSGDINDYCNVQNCDISFCGNNGIELGQGAGCIFDNNTINQCNSYGIYSYYASLFSVTNNTLTNISMIPGQSSGKQGNGGMYFSCNDGIIRYNTIKNTGYNGIFVRPGTLGTKINISYNYIDSVCLVLNDGGAIYSAGDWTGIRTIDHNIITNSIGNGAGAVRQTSLAEGIYLDEYASHLVITNNSVGNNGNTGIKLHKAHDNIITDNTIYNCGTGLGILNSSNAVVNWNESLRRNIFFAKNASQITCNFSSNVNDINLLGVADSSYYARPMDDVKSFTISQPSLPWAQRALTEWQTITTQDSHSKKSPIPVININDIRFETNTTKVPVTISLGAKYISVDSKIYDGSITLQPFCSAILMKYQNAVTKTVGTVGADFATLKLAFDDINTNAADIYKSVVNLQIINNTTETATAQLNAGSLGVKTVASIVGGNGFVTPKVTLSGGTVNIPGTLVTTVTNGFISSIVMTGGSYTGTFTVIIDAPGSGGVTATATVPASQTNANLVFTMTNGGSGYGPIATFSGGSPGSGAGLSVKIVSPATVPGSSPAGVALTIALARPGSGYTSIPTINIPNGWGGSGASAIVSALYNNYTTVNIYPTVTGKTIGGDINSPLITLYGANNVIIDGRLHNADGSLNGSTRDLTISNTGNTMGSANTIKFDAGASNNTVKYCTLKGSSNVDYMATINFASNGNSNNVIDHNLITNANNSKRPQISLISSGAIIPNDNNIISNNEFADCMSGTFYSRAIRIQTFNTNWTISGNSFYETTNLVPTTSGTNKTIIEIAASTGHTISGNYIGGCAAQCGGTALTKTAAFDNVFTIFNITNSTNPGPSNTNLLYLQNNTVKNISWSNSGTGLFTIASFVGAGISATGNTIGDTSIGSITYTPAVGGSFYGFNITNSGGGTVDCSNNNIGSITTINKTTLYGIFSNVLTSSIISGINTITGNTVGNLSTANSINLSSNVVDNVAFGIRIANPGTNIISGNTVANIVSYSASNSSGTAGIYGIKVENGTTTVNGNFINRLTLPTSIGSGVVKGISIENTSIATPATTTIFNNVVSLGDNTATNFMGLSELNAQGGSTTNIYFNSIFLGGTHPVGTGASSYGLRSNNSTTYNKNIKNNIIVNARTGGSVTHYAFYAAAPVTGGTFDCNYNDYYVSGTNGKLGNYGGTDKTALPIVTGQTGNDGNCLALNPLFLNPGGASATDYQTNASISLSGITIAGISTDFSTTPRGGIPRMGALESGFYTQLNHVDTTNPTIIINSEGIALALLEESNIELYSINGMLIEKIRISGIYTRKLSKGMYIICINGKASKFIR
ncbi:MAG: right-handed parallel beta-helix repeat-containing protein [Paludibacter sp.]